MWNRRTGFTLVELLTVLAIIGLLLALILPAVQQVRAAGLRTACLNQLKQIGLAHHGYHNQHGQLPPGLESDRPENKLPYLNWHVRLLPHLEQTALWDQALANYAADRNFLTAPHRPTAQLSMPLFVCPADGRTNSEGVRLAALTSYLGNCGQSWRNCDGLLYLDSRCRWDEVRDGLANTLLVGERPPSADRVFGWWYAGWGQAQDGSADSVLGVREFNIGDPYGSNCPPGPYAFRAGRLADQCSAFHFWSLHNGGAHFALADGSVRWLTYAADAILPQLASRAGGETVEWGD
jgi:prepilin-type N-terminal cleavage/methylation domain-containing protein/prepilin-type processing-associated H-X9-DG protein